MSVVLYAPDYASVPVIQCSPPSWMVHVLLVAKGVPHEVRWLDFAKGEHRTEAMRALNPRGTIPVLTHGEAVVSETFAILEYVDATLGEPWLPSGAARGRALTRLHETVYVKDAGMAAFRALMQPGPPPEGLWAALDAELDRWEAVLQASAWAAGDRMGLADLVLFTYVATAARLGWEFTGRSQRLQAAEGSRSRESGRRQRLRAHHDRMCAHPAVRATWPSTWEPPGGMLAP
ncbi:MAG: glutathione S-transferase family protein [Alphaproteobacteria bacterium]|nr:glutathione S-transferase family protein [Alphaproteobacteria bacterium]